MESFDKEVGSQQGLDREKIVFTLDIGGNFNFINRAGELFIGYTCLEVRRLNVLDLLPHKTAEEVRAFVKHAIRQRFGTVFEVEIVTRDRRRFAVETSVDLVRRVDGALEFQGIALVQREDTHPRPLVPRCLDPKFPFRLASSRRAEPYLDALGYKSGGEEV